MKILVLADNIQQLREWVRESLVGHDKAFSEPRLHARVDGVDFYLRPYDMADTVAGMAFNTVLHVGDTPLLVRHFIRVRPKV